MYAARARTVHVDLVDHHQPRRAASLRSPRIASRALAFRTVTVTV